MKKQTNKPVKTETRGRKSAFDKIDLRQVESLAGLGLTDVEISVVLGISRATLSNYKSKPIFLDTLKRGKVVADSQVIKSLYKRALGGDTVACIFWLKNRRPGDWRDKQEVEHSGGIKVIRDNI